jgi:hypothetical protein
LSLGYSVATATRKEADEAVICQNNRLYVWLITVLNNELNRVISKKPLQSVNDIKLEEFI